MADRTQSFVAASPKLRPRLAPFLNPRPAPRSREGSVTARKKRMNRRGGKIRLGQEPEGRALVDQALEVLPVLRRDQDHLGRLRPGRELSRDVEAAFSTELDVDQRQLRSQFVRLAERVTGG